jgi:hypothetical protein
MWSAHPGALGDALRLRPPEQRRTARERQRVTGRHAADSCSAGAEEGHAPKNRPAPTPKLEKPPEAGSELARPRLAAAPTLRLTPPSAGGLLRRGAGQPLKAHRTELSTAAQGSLFGVDLAFLGG